MRVLVTGAAGSIGTVVCRGLLERGHEVIGLDRAAEPGGFAGPWHTADCADPDAVAAVFADLDHSGGVEGVVHLAGIPTEAALDVALASHVVTTGVLLDAMLAHGVSRFVFASSNHAVGRTPRSDLLRVDVPPRPDTFYGVAKVAAEALLRLSVDRHGIDAVALRIGSFQERPRSRRALSTWLSHDDAVRLVEAALTAPAPGFAVLYGVSANTRGWWDLEPGRALGYHPQDDAERFADPIESGEPTERDEFAGRHVGGEYAGERFHRPAVEGHREHAAGDPGRRP